MASAYDIARHSGIREEFVNRVFDSLIEVLQQDDRGLVIIRSFGSFQLRRKAARVFKSPILPGGAGTAKEKVTIRFHPTEAAKKRLNGNSARAASLPRRRAATGEVFTKGKGPK